MSVTLALNAGIGFATAGVFAYVGALMLRRSVGDAGARRAMGTFAAWWFSLAVLTAAGAARMTLAAAGNLDLLPHLVLSELAVVPLVVALWGLLYYLLYIYTGNGRLFWPLTVAYGAVLAWFVYLTWWLQPVRIVARTWNVDIEYARADALEGPIGAVALALILGPVLIAAALYASLLFRATDRGVRYRIGMVSGAFLLWFGSSAIASIAELTTADWWPPLARLVGLLATFMVLAAYRPPAAVRAWLGVEDVTRARPAAKRRRARLKPALASPSPA